jgi:transglutaminase-like putative cysteine protease
VFHVAVAEHRPASVTELLSIELDGSPVEPQVLDAPHGGRWHVVDVPPVQVTVNYTATVAGRAAPAQVAPGDDIRYRLPSRYAESDRLFTLARSEFAGTTDPAELALSVSGWVHQRLSYVFGSSRPTDGAVDTLLSGQGVCRDYAHLTVGILRALDLPARAVAVYAPGLAPMDFHLVTEVLVDGAWFVVDSTRLAPRESMVRIATGRDATDTAFLSNFGGDVHLLGQGVMATVDLPELPVDDPGQLVVLG